MTTRDRSEWLTAILAVLTAVVLLVLASASKAQCVGGVCPQPSGGFATTWPDPLAQPPSTTPESAHETDCIVRVPEGDAIYSGSGTVVAREGQASYVLTNHHVVSSERTGQVMAAVRVEVPRLQQVYPGTVIATDEEFDLALIRVDTPLSSVIVAEQMPSGQVELMLRGFPKGNPRLFRARRATIIGTFGRGVIASGGAIDGESGGGVYCDRKLVGVMWGSREGAYCTPLAPIRRLLARVLPQRFSVNVNVVTPAPATDPLLQRPLPGPETGNTVCDPRLPAAVPQGCDCREQFAAIEAKLQEQAEINAASTRVLEKVGAALERHDKLLAELGEAQAVPGPEGPAGPPGKDGADGQSPTIDIDALTAAVAAKLATTQPQPEQPTEPTEAGRILYFTSTKGAPAAAPIDAKMRALKERGHPITIIDLDPTQTVVAGVPRIFIPATNREVTGIANCEFYLAQIVP